MLPERLVVYKLLQRQRRFDELGAVDGAAWDMRPFVDEQESEHGRREGAVRAAEGGAAGTALPQELGDNIQRRIRGRFVHVSMVALEVRLQPLGAPEPFITNQANLRERRRAGRCLRVGAQ